VAGTCCEVAAASRGTRVFRNRRDQVAEGKGTSGLRVTEGPVCTENSCMDGARGAREKLTISEAFGCGHVFGL
jgi:anaerobic ribonucleoside-triphosphate reductase